MNVLHSKESSQHYTPLAIVEAARNVLGGIDLDPASSELANKTIKAELIYTEEDDGLSLDWAGRVFLNPPGNTKADKKRPAKPVRFWKKLIDSYIVEEVESAIFIGFSLEQLQQIQLYSDTSPLDFPFCVPKRRIAFDRPTEDGEILSADTKGRVAGKQPTHANYICLLPPLDEEIGQLCIHAFEAEFSAFGAVVLP